MGLVMATKHLSQDPATVENNENDCPNELDPKSPTEDVVNCSEKKSSVLMKTDEEKSSSLGAEEKSKCRNSELDNDSDTASEVLERRRSGRAPQKRKERDFIIVQANRKPKSKSTKSTNNHKIEEDNVLLDTLEEDVQKSERSQISQILSEITEQKAQDNCYAWAEEHNKAKVPQLKLMKFPDEKIEKVIAEVGCVPEASKQDKENEVNASGVSGGGVSSSTENCVEEGSDEVVETEEQRMIRLAIEDWYDVVSKKSHEEMDDEVARILARDYDMQLRPNMKKAKLTSNAEERFREHVFEKAKLRKRRHSEDDEDDNDLYIPSQPKLYKKAFVVEAIRQMEIDRWGEDYYLVKWEDWPEERNTWEPALHLDNCDMVIAQFRRKLKQLPEYQTARKLQIKALKAFSDKLFDPRCPKVPRIEVINDVDLTTPNDNFDYRGVLNWPKNRVPISICCDCEECGDGCPCATIDGHKFAYKPDGSLKVLTGNPIYECSSGCKCSIETCRNKVVQRGRSVRLQLFKTPNGRGWGLRTLDPIKRNTFVVEYVGEVLPFSEAELRGMVYDARGRTYLFDMDFFQKPGEYTIDAMKSGNEARYFNHACNPNLFSMCVWYNSIDPFYHHVAFFAKSDIAAGKELSINYKNAGLTYNQHLDDKESKANSIEASETGTDVTSSDGANNNAQAAAESSEAKEKVPCRCHKNCTDYLFVD